MSDLSDRGQRARVYEVVLREGTPDDMRSFIDGALLVDLWDELVLPRRLRSAGGGASVMPSFGWYTGVHPWTYATFGSSIASFPVNTRAPFRRPPRTRRAGSEAGEGSRVAASAKVGAEAGDAGPRV